jgi:hypothetical protein
MSTSVVSLCCQIELLHIPTDMERDGPRALAEHIIIISVWYCRHTPRANLFTAG